jgi:CheY-like chemotaxis protein
MIQKKVLTVDDSKAVRMILARHLKQFGVEIVEAENGAVGLIKARETKPNLILLDYNMPVMDGYQTLECLKKDPVARTIPVIMLTTEAVQETVVKLIKLGLRDYITKPFARNDFLKKVNGVLHLFEGEVPLEGAPIAAGAKPGENGDGQAQAAPPKKVVLSPKKFLAEMDGIGVLRFPGEQDPTADEFLHALGCDIPMELDQMAQEGCHQLIIQLSPIFMSDPFVRRKFNLLMNFIKRHDILVKVVAYSEKARMGFQQVADQLNIEIFDSLERAVGAFAAA